MKTAIKLILIDLLIAQIVAPILIMIPCTIYLLVTTGDLDKVALTQMIMIPAQLAGQIMMGIYLWKAGYISKSYKLKKDVVESFAKACEQAQTSQAGQLTKMMQQFIESVSDSDTFAVSSRLTNTSPPSTGARFR